MKNNPIFVYYTVHQVRIINPIIKLYPIRYELPFKVSNYTL